jgi:hypothetical protein
MSNYTLTYSQSSKGWPSFYSFYPEWMIGMNNYFYSFRGGNIYRHNVNNNRNTFYQDWWTSQGMPLEAFKPATLQSVLNAAVLENKLFKTIVIQGDATWAFTLETDLQNSGYIESGWFQRKEATYFAFIRNNSSGQLALRSLNGIGNSTTRVIFGSTVTINFSINPLISVGSIVSVGDYLYFGSSTPQFAGQITQINVNYPAGINQLVITTSVPGMVAVPIPTNVQFFLYIKNSIAESHGVLGHYCKFNMSNVSTSKVEMFTVESEVMKSFP